MMKTISVLMAAWILSLGIWCQAAESENITEDPLQSDVYARSRYSKAWIEVPVSQGEAVAALPDGTLIEVIDAPEGAVLFKVILIDPSRQEAWHWINSCFDEKANLYQVYDLSFEDNQGNRISIDQSQITVKGGKESDCTISSLGTEGDVIELTSSSQNNELLFQGNKHRYYVLNLEDTSDMPGDVVSPPTSSQGENCRVFFLTVFSGIAIIFIQGRLDKD